MVLQNYVILTPGVPARLHFTEHHLQVVTVTDPVTGRPTPKNRLVFQVDELNNQPVVSQYSTLSQKHAADFAPFLVGEKYKDYDFIITVTGTGFQTEYRVQPILRAK